MQQKVAKLDRTAVELAEERREMVQIINAVLSDWVQSRSDRLAAVLLLRQRSLQKFHTRYRLRLSSLDETMANTFVTSAFWRARIDDYLNQPTRIDTHLEAKQLVEGLVAHRPWNPEHQRVLGEIEHCLAVIYHRDRDFPSADEAFLRSLKIRLALHRRFPAATLYQSDLARSFGYHGDLQMDRNDARGAIKSYLQSLELRRAIAAQNSDDSIAQLQYSRAYRNFARVYMAAGKLQQAHDALFHARHLVEQILAAKPEVPPDQLISANLVVGDFANEAATLHEEIGFVHDLQGDLAGARFAFEQARRAHEQLANRNPGYPRFQIGLPRSLVYTGLLRRRQNDQTFSQSLNQAHEHFQSLRSQGNAFLSDPVNLRDEALLRCLRGVASLDADPELALQRLRESSQTIQQQLERNPQDWRLAQTSYLIHSQIVEALAGRLKLQRFYRPISYQGTEELFRSSRDHLEQAMKIKNAIRSQVARALKEVEREVKYTLQIPLD